MRLLNPLANGRHGAIVEIAAAAQAYGDVVPMWFGESDLPTPFFIREAAERALRAGQTHYAPRRGLPQLRAEIASYLARLYGTRVDVERITVTASGMNAIMVALQAICGAGGNVVVVSPIWPNVTNAIAALGIGCRRVGLRRERSAWSLDLDELFDAVDASTRAVFIASPGNPTGWICEAPEQQRILDFCRSRDIYVIADEVYQRIVFDRPVAPSFLQAAGASEEGLVIVNSFSKTWAMSGWRLGWLVHPQIDAACIGELNAVNNTGASTFVQHAGIAAIREGEAFVQRMRRHCTRGCELVSARLEALPQVRFIRPSAALYAFFSLDGVTDSVQFARELATQTGVGLAPGSAFGDGCESFLRLCYALDEERLASAMERLTRFIGEWYRRAACA